MRRIVLLIILAACGFWGYPTDPIDLRAYSTPETLFLQQSDTTLTGAEQERVLRETVRFYESALEHSAGGDRARALRHLAFSYAQLENPGKATENVRKYLHAEFRPAVLESVFFDPVRESPEFREVLETYTPQLSAWTFIYLYVGLIGFYIAAILFLHRRIDRTARFLVGIFVCIHSVFILHICLVISNYQFEFPHSYLMSTGFSFLYGPLLYMYFKRTTQNYDFRTFDLLHLLPTVFLLVVLIPIYNQSGGEKLELMLGRVLNGINPSDSANLVLIVTAKLGSLMFYGWLIRREFIRKFRQEAEPGLKTRWMRNIYRIHVAYIVCYAIYGALIIYQETPGGLLYHAQVLAMSLMVLYVGYFASLRPQVFSLGLTLDKPIFGKYKKSGLTESLSCELRDKLLVLFDRDEIYRENDLNLETLAERMETTRHNASQVINEHFRLSFHELVNKYRIEQAKQLLRTDYQGNLNIIDIAYEVGYNNKVTFNKAFKKDTQLTPSQYQARRRELQVKEA